MFGFARNTPATFDVSCRLQVTNYGFLYVLFDPAPGGANCTDVWDLSLHRQMAFPKLFRSDVLATSRGRSKPKRFLVACITRCEGTAILCHIVRKSSPSRHPSDTARRYEQKHLLHNWRNCRDHNRAQTARHILGFSVAGRLVLTTYLRCRRALGRQRFVVNSG
jgi:hypothetical protein